MKRKFFILLPLICLTIYITLTSSSGGIAGVSTSGCSCHGVASSNTIVTITGLPSGGYTNGTVYPITVNVTNTVLTPAAGGVGLRDGFDLLASSGTFTAIAGTAATASPVEIRHTTPKAPVAGTASWTFNWTAPATGNASITFNLAGNATNGSSSTVGDQWNLTTVYLVKNGAPFGVTATNTAISCNGGTSTITAVGQGGTPPYQYQRNTSAFQTSPTFASNLANTYTITVRDATNATSSTVLTISQPSLITVTASAPAIPCNGGNTTITANASGGTGAFNYRLNTGAFQVSPTFANNITGTYTITARDANLCTRTTTLFVSQPNLLTFPAPTITHPLCNGGTGSVIAPASGGTGTKTYTISPLGPQSNTLGSFSGLTAQAYTITVTDANLCTRTTAVTLTQPSAMVFGSSSIIQPSCDGGTGSVTVSATGGTGAKTYTIDPFGPQSNSSGVFTNLFAGTYTITATDNNNCIKTTTAIITAPPPIKFISPQVQRSSCTGNSGSISLTATGGVGNFIYAINPAVLPNNTTGVFNNLSAQTYTITATDDNLCNKTIVLKVGALPGNFTISTNAASQPCVGGTTTINSTTTATAGPLTYQWYSIDYDSTELQPLKDNTIIEMNPGNSNGAGPYIAVGRNNTSGGPKTRGLLAFDVNDMPVDALVTEANLSLYCSITSGAAGMQNHSIHKANNDWGEGLSNTASAGIGAPALTDDATWVNRFHPGINWVNAGGDFNPTVSATTPVDGIGTYQWSSPSLLQDVRDWRLNPGLNFGWLLKSEELTFPDAKRYDSKEGTNPPTLKVKYIVYTSGVLSTTDALTNAGAGRYMVIVTDANGCTATSTITITETPCNSQLNLTMYLQGYYLGGGVMDAVLLNQLVPGALATETDDIIIKLLDATFAEAASIPTKLQTNGTAVCNLPPLSGSYWLVVEHRNSIQTWSSSMITIGPGINTYNFTTSAGQAYGGNQVELETGIYGFYTGDINQDFSIDALDYLILDPDIQAGNSGYLTTDLNGDGSVDALDYLMIDPNIISGIGVAAP